MIFAEITCSDNIVLINILPPSILTVTIIIVTIIDNDEKKIGSLEKVNVIAFLSNIRSHKYQKK